MKIFVLMPFNEEAGKVYETILLPKLGVNGRTVRRADSDLNQVNVLRDILTGIAEADLIVADLTGANPNVMYELGIAHALNKKVIHITQDVGNLPFDLKNYRAIEYDPSDFQLMFNLADVLSDALDKVSTGEMKFGNPVSDFYQSAKDFTCAPLAAIDSERPGLIEVFSNFGEPSNVYADALESVNVILSEWGDYLSSETTSIKTLGTGSNLAARLGVSKRISDASAIWTNRLRTHVRILDELGYILGDLVLFGRLAFQDLSKEELDSLHSVFHDLSNNARQLTRIIQPTFGSFDAIGALSKDLRRSMKDAKELFVEVCEVFDRIATASDILAGNSILD